MEYWEQLCPGGYRFVYDAALFRPGTDTFLLSSLPRLSILSWVALGCLAFATFRLFSKNLTKRRAENAKFLELVRPIARKYNVSKSRRQDREHCYFKCPNCGQQLRVPKGKGKISITCRSCGVSFEKKT